MNRLISIKLSGVQCWRCPDCEVILKYEDDECDCDPYVNLNKDGQK